MKYRLGFIVVISLVIALSGCSTSASTQATQPAARPGVNPANSARPTTATVSVIATPASTGAANTEQTQMPAAIMGKVLRSLTLRLQFKTCGNRVRLPLL